MFWRKKSYFDNSAPDIKNRRKQPCQVRYMAPIEQFFVTLNVATPDLFARFDKRKDRQKLRQAINPSAGMLRSGLIKVWCAFRIRRAYLIKSTLSFVVVISSDPADSWDTFTHIVCVYFIGTRTILISCDIIQWKHFLHYWPFVREFAGHWWIPLTKASDAELWSFLWSAPE